MIKKYGKKFLNRLGLQRVSKLQDSTFFIRPNRFASIDLRELVLQENKEVFNRYDIIVRYLAIENYYKKNETGFALYKKMQVARKGGDYNERMDTFKELIQSYEKGYKRESHILLDSNLCLIDGSHRIALGLYNKFHEISCFVEPQSRHIKYGIDWFIENKFSLEELNLLIEKFREIKQEVTKPFVCILWSPAQSFFDEITELLKISYKVLSYKDFAYNDNQFVAIAKNIYVADNIESWKIEEKIKMIVSCPVKKIRVIELEIERPKFRLNDISSETLSGEGETIKRIIKNAYQDKIENYFHDVIIHIGDNYAHNEYISKLFNLKPQA